MVISIKRLEHLWGRGVCGAGAPRAAPDGRALLQELAHLLLPPNPPSRRTSQISWILLGLSAGNAVPSGGAGGTQRAGAAVGVTESQLSC